MESSVHRLMVKLVPQCLKYPCLNAFVISFSNCWIKMFHFHPIGSTAVVWLAYLIEASWRHKMSDILIDIYSCHWLSTVGCQAMPVTIPTYWCLVAKQLTQICFIAKTHIFPCLLFIENSFCVIAAILQPDSNIISRRSNYRHKTITGAHL